jgi:broad specificity phosphatase PhoE
VGALGIVDAPTFIYCSPFMRCIETATQIALELGVPRILLYPEVGESLMDGFFTKDPRPGLLVRTKDMSNHPVAIEEAAPFQDSPWPENWGQMNRRYKEGIDNLIA